MPYKLSCKPFFYAAGKCGAMNANTINVVVFQKAQILIFGLFVSYYHVDLSINKEYNGFDTGTIKVILWCMTRL